MHLLVRGEVDAVSATSISVKPKDGSATQTCTVKSADDVKRVEKGDKVEMTCVQLAGVWTLAKVRERAKHAGHGQRRAPPGALRRSRTER